MNNNSIPFEEWILTDTELKYQAIKELNVGLEKVKEKKEVRKMIYYHVKRMKEKLAEEEAEEKRFQEFKKKYIVELEECNREDLIDKVARLQYSNIKLSKLVNSLNDEVEDLEGALQYARDEADRNWIAISNAECYADSLLSDLESAYSEASLEEEMYEDTISMLKEGYNTLLDDI